ncbi:MAG: FAD-dependent oxidoreductase [Lachnospiraceae bacterium]|nr:FAD-dependent oxidoreductase [Lachnospiraceae bacterium]
MEKKYDVIIIGAGPGGIFSAYEFASKRPDLKVAVFEAGHPLEKRRCPIDGDKIKSCIKCPTCAIMNGFGGAGAFSDGKYNITNDFGGTLHEHIGKTKAIELMKYVDSINVSHGGEQTKMYSTAGSSLKKVCMQNKLQLLEASVRHLGTDINYVVLKNLYDELKDKVDFYYDTSVTRLEVLGGSAAAGVAASGGCAVSGDGETSGSFAAAGCSSVPGIGNAANEHSTLNGSGFRVWYGTNAETATARYVIASVGRSGSSWMEKVCNELAIPTLSNRVDIGVRVELPAVIFSHLTDELYESKIVYRTEKFEDRVRTFCMNPYGIVVNENTNGIVTVNGHSFEDPSKRTQNTNFALLVSKHFSEPFKDSNGYGESIARLSNMLGGGVIVQRFGDLERGRRSNRTRIAEGLVRPTLDATPGDLSLVLPKRILDGIIEMIYALDKIAPGTANDDTLLYGVEVKFYNMEVELSEHLETRYPGFYCIGDGSGVTHSLSHASASGVYVADRICKEA